MQKHKIQVAQEDVERVDTLRYMWDKLQQQVASLQSTLLKVQPRFRSALIEKVEIYQHEVKSFTTDYTDVSRWNILTTYMTFPFLSSSLFRMVPWHKVLLPEKQVIDLYFSR